MKTYVLVEHSDGKENYAKICVGESNLRSAVERAIFGEARPSDKEQQAMVDAYMVELKDEYRISFEGDPPLTLAELDPQSAAAL